MAIVLEVRSAQGDVTLQTLQPGRNRITVRPGDAYRVIDAETQHTPAGATVKRVENSLLIDGLDIAEGANAGQAPTVVELVDYYGICSAGSPCDVIVDIAGTTPVVISPISSSIGALADGSYVLYDPNWVAPPETPEVASNDSLSRPMLYGLGGVAVAGLALAGGGGGGSSDGPVTPPSDATLKVTSSASTNSRTPVISGTGEPGSTVVLQMDTNNDGTSDLRYEVAVAGDGTWTVNLGTATPTSGRLPAGGLPDSTQIQVSSGNNVLPIYTLVFDDVPPAPARVDPITVDGVISGPEKAAGIQVTGSAEAGGTVLVIWGSLQKVAPVDANGRWVVPFTSTEIPANGQSEISVISRDAAGNAGSPTVAPVRVNTDGPILSVIQVGSNSDTTINAAEASGGVTIRGTADANASITVNWNGVVLPAVANASGQWQVTFAPGQVPNPTTADGAIYPLIVNGTSVVGNAATLEVPIRVDLVGPGAPEIAAISGDDRISPTERNSSVRVSGSSEANASITVQWGDTTLQTEANASGQWTVTFAPTQIPTAGTGGSAAPITARATDAAGNAGGSSSRSVFIEQPYTAPTIANVAGDNVVSAAERDGNITISGTVQAGAPGVTVTWGSFSQTVTPNGNTWSVTVPAAQVPADGATTVVAAIAVADGASTSRAVTVDTRAPTAPTIAAVEGDNRVTQAEAADGTRVSGTAEANATITVSWQGVTHTVSANAQGQWFADFTATQVGSTPGNTTVTAAATDAAGNRSTTTSVTVVVDPPLTAPTIAAIATDNTVNAAEATAGVVIRGTHAAGAAGISVRVGDQSFDATLGAGNTWEVTVPRATWQAVGDGPTTVTVSNAGTGGGASNSAQIVVDLTPPVITIAPVSVDNQVTITETNVVVSGTAPGAATVTMVTGDIRGGPYTAVVGADGTWRFVIGRMDTNFGDHDLTVTATDSAGNSSTATRTITVVVIDVPPGGSTSALDAGAVVVGTVATKAFTDTLTLEALITAEGSGHGHALLPALTTTVALPASSLLDEATQLPTSLG